MRCRYGESPAAPLVASLEAYERAIGEGAAPFPLPLYMERQPSLQLSSRCICYLWHCCHLCLQA